MTAKWFFALADCFLGTWIDNCFRVTITFAIYTHDAINPLVCLPEEAVAASLLEVTCSPILVPN
jgi:hypothetical protein